MRCRACQTVGKAVDALTVKALLTERALSRYEPVEYRFCDDSSCDVVYFTATETRFGVRDVREPIWQKQPIGRRMICYCFGENEADICEELDRTGESLAGQRVRGHITAGRCACEVRNPKGACCLGDIDAAVDRMRLNSVTQPGQR